MCHFMDYIGSIIFWWVPPRKRSLKLSTLLTTSSVSAIFTVTISVSATSSVTFSAISSATVSAVTSATASLVSTAFSATYLVILSAAFSAMVLAATSATLSVTATSSVPDSATCSVTESATTCSVSDRPGHLFGDALVSSCNSSSRCCSPRLMALMCRSPPPPQSWLALGLGAAVSRGRGVPELCPHLASTWKLARCGHSSGTSLPLVTAAPRPSVSRDCVGGGDLHTSAVRRGEQRQELLLLLTRASLKR